MTKSIFSDLLDKYMPKFDLLYKTYNEKKGKAAHLFATMLRSKYSVSQTWESADIQNSVVSADIVELDSSLPLKRRDRISYATGELPKIGMKMKLKESDLNRLQIMKALNRNLTEVVSELFGDAVHCVDGVNEAIERMFLEALSNEGVIEIDQNTNTGKAIRVNFGFFPENSFNAEFSWNGTDPKPISDLRRVISEAYQKGTSIRYVMLAQEVYDRMRNSTEAKELFAAFSGMPIFPNQALSTPNKNGFNNSIKDELGVDFIIVDRVVRIEKNGKQANLKPWNRDKVVFLSTKEVGTLYYGSLAEESNPNKNVNYHKHNNMILVKKWHTEDPFEEWTSSQAIALPVITNPREIYTLDINGGDPTIDTNETEGDNYITLWNVRFLKAEVIRILNEMDIQTSSSITDSSLVRKINNLSKANKETLKTYLGEFTAE